MCKPAKMIPHNNALQLVALQDSGSAARHTKFPTLVAPAGAAGANNVFEEAISLHTGARQDLDGLSLYS